MTPATRIAIRSGSIHAVRVVVLSGAINLNTVIMENDIILSADKRPALLMHGNGIRMDLVRSDLRIDMGACGGTVSLLDMRGATVRTIRMSGPGTVGLGGLSAGAYTVTARTDRGDFAHMGLIVNKR
jgi:hypothetical protein